jgi:hypothetical protein
LYVKCVLHLKLLSIIIKPKKCYKKYKMIKYHKFHKLPKKIYKVLVSHRKLKKYLHGKLDLPIVHLLLLEYFKIN